MRVPIGWLADFIDLPTRDPHQLEQILVSLGHEVEGIEEFKPSFEGVIVGRVEEVDEHRGQVTVLISVFGRETPVALDFIQVEKV